MWLDDDVTAALEWDEYRSSRCSCGQPRHESMDPANDGAYVASPIQCFACATKDAEMRRAAKARSSGQYGDGAFDGVYFAVERREEVSDG